MQRSPRVSVLNVALLRLRRKPLWGLASDQNLPFLNEHVVVLSRAILVRVTRIRGQALFIPGITALQGVNLHSHAGGFL
jgi:hypothetical protein